MSKLDVLRRARKQLYIFKEVYCLGGNAKEILDKIDGQLQVLEDLMTGALPDQEEPKYHDILSGEWGDEQAYQ